MEKRKSGHVVNITTSLLDGANSNAPSVLASLTKGGLDATTRSLAIECAKRWGAQSATFGGASVWVLPNPSGLNRGFSFDALVAAYRELLAALNAPRS